MLVSASRWVWFESTYSHENGGSSADSTGEWDPSCFTASAAPAASFSASVVALSLWPSCVSSTFALSSTPFTSSDVLLRAPFNPEIFSEEDSQYLKLDNQKQPL